MLQKLKSAIVAKEHDHHKLSRLFDRFANMPPIWPNSTIFYRRGQQDNAAINDGDDDRSNRAPREWPKCRNQSALRRFRPGLYKLI